MKLLNLLSLFFLSMCLITLCCTSCRNGKLEHHECSSKAKKIFLFLEKPLDEDLQFLSSDFKDLHFDNERQGDISYEVKGEKNNQEINKENFYLSTKRLWGNGHLSLKESVLFVDDMKDFRGTISCQEKCLIITNSEIDCKIEGENNIHFYHLEGLKNYRKSSNEEKNIYEGYKSYAANWLKTSVPEKVLSFEYEKDKYCFFELVKNDESKIIKPFQKIIQISYNVKNALGPQKCSQVKKVFESEIQKKLLKKIVFPDGSSLYVSQDILLNGQDNPLLIMMKDLKDLKEEPRISNENPWENSFERISIFSFENNQQVKEAKRAMRSGFVLYSFSRKD